jgi:hypothetical protein
MEQYSIAFMFGGMVLIMIAGTLFAPRFPPHERRRPGVLPGRRVEGRRPPMRQR